MPPFFDYDERTGDVSPASASFTERSQTASAPYITEPVAFKDLPNRLIDVLGYTGTRVLSGENAGKLNRVLPLRHPQYQWLFADSFRPRGVGTDNALVTPSPGPGSAIIPQFPLYKTYECDISFSQRDYNCWQDKDVKLVTDTGYRKDGTSYAFTFANEWMRFCKFESSPMNNFISAQQGAMKFRNGGTGLAPDGFQYQDAPRMYLPDSALRVTWLGVPYRYLTSPNSYLRKFVGHVNQQDWGDEPDGAKYGPYKAGALLYHGARPVNIRQNVVPDEGLLAASTGGNGFARARVCDLELDFTITERTVGDPANAPTFANKNRVVAGHNLLPHLGRRAFFYATTFDDAAPTDQAKWVPSFNSFPFSLLFTDPDAAGGSPSLDP